MSGAASVGMHKRGKTLHLEVSKDQSYSPQDPSHPPTAFLMRAERGKKGERQGQRKGRREGGTLFPH